MVKPVTESGLEVVEPSPVHATTTDSELEALRQEQLKIQDERQRLSRMPALNIEERRIRQRIKQISGSTCTFSVLQSTRTLGNLLTRYELELFDGDNYYP